jgi:hypothetical protein
VPFAFGRERIGGKHHRDFYPDKIFHPFAMELAQLPGIK